MREEASAGEEDIQSIPLIILKEKADSKNSRNIWFSARLDPGKDHRLMIPKECPLARSPTFPITTQLTRGEGKGGGDVKSFVLVIKLFEKNIL